MNTNELNQESVLQSTQSLKNTAPLSNLKPLEPTPFTFSSGTNQHAGSIRSMATGISDQDLLSYAQGGTIPYQFTSDLPNTDNIPGNFSVPGSFNVAMSYIPVLGDSLTLSGDPIPTYFIYVKQEFSLYASKGAHFYMFGTCIHEDIEHEFASGQYSPKSTLGTGSTTESVSATVGANVGFFGDTPTGGVSSSLTMSSSVTQNFTDVRAVCSIGDWGGRSADWQYYLSGNTATGNFAPTNQWIWTVPVSSLNGKTSLTMSIHFIVEDGDCTKGDVWSPPITIKLPKQRGAQKLT